MKYTIQSIIDYICLHLHMDTMATMPFMIVFILFLVIIVTGTIALLKFIWYFIKNIRF